MVPSLYSLKNLALLPRRAYRRRRNPDLDGYVRTMYEQAYYRNPVRDFFGATVRKPDILVDLDIDRDSVVFDVGAFRGEWAELVWARSQPTIHCFEPSPSACRRMVETFSGNPRIHVHQFGLGASNTDASLYLDGPGSSVYERPVSSVGQIDVQIRDVVQVLGELDVTEIDVMKVNIEGGEFDLLDRLDEADWLPRIRLVLVQFHEWLPSAHRRRRRNRRALQRHHEEVWSYPWVWELWRRS